jgi:RHS repeat-associated protein
VQGLTDGSGAVQDQIVYDGTGQITSESNAGFGDGFHWTGQWWDKDVGYQYNRARWYDPRTERWTTQDPMGFDAGDSNISRYVGNDTPNASDPSGKWEDNRAHVDAYYAWQAEQRAVATRLLDLRPDGNSGTTSVLLRVAKLQQQSEAMAMLLGPFARQGAGAGMQGLLFAQNDQGPGLTLPPPRLFLTFGESPLKKYLCKKIVVDPLKPLPPDFYRYPEKFGLRTRDPLSTLSAAEHALGGSPSAYTSASERMFGASNIPKAHLNRRIWIDVNAYIKAGGEIISHAELVELMDKLAREKPEFAQRVREWKTAQAAEREALLKQASKLEAGKNALRTGRQMALIRARQGLTVVAVVSSAVDVSKAAAKSVEKESARPLAAEGVRQAGAWGFAYAGGKVGAGLGVYAGPWGLLIGGIAGSVVFGTVGYLGGNRVAGLIDIPD